MNAAEKASALLTKVEAMLASAAILPDGCELSGGLTFQTPLDVVQAIAELVRRPMDPVFVCGATHGAIEGVTVVRRGATVTFNFHRRATPEEMATAMSAEATS